MKSKGNHKENVQVITLGCSKNLVDSEMLINQLQHNEIPVHHGDLLMPDTEVVVVNTCGFIDRAKQESIDTILAYAKLKEKGTINKLYVTGCLSHRYKDDLSREIPEVDAWFGTMELPGLLAKFNADYKQDLLGERTYTTPMHYAYLKISEGCNRTCSFCAIPLMRGKHRSKSIEDLVAEAKNLASQGVKELILIAQELTYYGLDLYKERKLSELLQALCTVEGIEWIRLHYAYPSKFPLDVLKVIHDEPKICNYLDIPLQHASDPVLKRMRRQISNAETRSLISLIREAVPKIAVRTTMLVGFPGETEEDVDELIRFIQEMRFERVGVFEYSHEEGTSAMEFEDDVPAEIKTARAQRVMEAQQAIALEKNEALIGTTMKVLIDRFEGGSFIGRTEFDSPEVDNEVHLNSPKEHVRIGDFIDVRIVDATEYDLYAERFLP